MEWGGRIDEVLMPEQRLNVTAAAKHAKNEHVLFPKAVDDEVLTHGEASQAGAQVLLAGTSYIGMAVESTRRSAMSRLPLLDAT